MNQKELKGLATVGLGPGGLGQGDCHKQKGIPIDDLMELIAQEGWSAKELAALGGNKLNLVVDQLKVYDDEKLIEFFNNEGLQPELSVELFSKLDDDKKQSPQILLVAFQKNARCLQYAFTLNGEQEIIQAIIDKYNENKPRNSSQDLGFFASPSSSAAPQPAQTLISNIVGRLEQEEKTGGDSEKNKIVEILESIIGEANSFPGLGSS